MGYSLCSCGNRWDNATEYLIEQAKSIKKDLYLNNLIQNIDKLIISKGISFTKEESEKLNSIIMMSHLRRLQNFYRSYLIKKKMKIGVKANGINTLRTRTKAFYFQNSDDEYLHSYKHEDGSLNTSRSFKQLKGTKLNFKYIGDKIDGKKEGFGIQIWLDGTNYIGTFKKGHASGYGCFQHQDGDKYIGQMSNDKANNYGIYAYNNGTNYEGQWLDDTQHGLGLEICKDDSFYSGEYVRGKKEGMGTYSFNESSYYEGEWYENNFHGFGIYKFSDAKTYMGQWRYSSMHGYGEFHWNDGRKYAGFYIQNKKEGFGIYFWEKENKAYVGFWKDGKQHGVGKYIKEGSIQYGLWRDGTKVKWFKGEKESFSFLNPNQKKFCELFKHDLNDIIAFLKS